MSFNDMIYTKLLNTYRINSIHSEKLLAIWIHIQKLQLFDKTFVAFFILYKFHGTLIEMNLNTHIFSQKIKLIVSSLYRNLPINPGTFFRLPHFIYLFNLENHITHFRQLLTVSKSFYQINKSTQNCDTFKFSKKKNKNI